jgi:uncharacterized membrane protein YhhN
MMPKRALAEKRPWLLASLFFGLTFMAVNGSAMPGLYQMAWKGAAVSFLAVYAMLRHGSRDARFLSGIMALGALGDMLIEVDLTAGAAAFLAGHVLAIGLYALHRREKLSASQRILGIALAVLVPLIAWILPDDRATAPAVAAYALGLGCMAGMAWTSNFPRYRVGTGSLLFVVSDLLIFARLGPLQGNEIAHLLIWPTYYFGQFLICVGVLGTLREREL